ncbi:MAG: DUF6089 family protein [Bacteroidia bacterium]
MIKNTNIKLLSVLVFGLYLFAGTTTAQNLEGGILIGGSNYNGDLSGRFIDVTQSHMAGGVLVRYNLDERWTLKGYFGYGKISGSDNHSTHNPYNFKRNLHFFSDIFEMSGHIEYNLLKIDNRYYSRRPYVPYVFIGLGVYNFNPKTITNNTVYELQPLGTEGQGTTTYNDLEKYALTQFCVPFGAGIKKKISRRWTIGFEVGCRYTFTNYLDDVGGTYASVGVIRNSNGEIAAILSDRSGDSNKGVPIFSEGDKRSNKQFKVNDMYFFGGLTITFKIKGKTLCPRFN